MKTPLIILLGLVMALNAEANLADFDKLWDYSNPKDTQEKFEKLLPEAKQSGNKSIYLQLLTQIARCQGLQRNFDGAHLTLDQVKSELSDKLPLVNARYLLERGRVFRSAGDPDKSKPVFLEAYEKAKVAGVDYFTVDAAHMLGIVEKTLDDQMKWNLIALEIAEKSKDEKTQGWAASLTNNMGWSNHDAGKFNEALKMFEKALFYHEKFGTPMNIHIAKWSVARANRSLGKLEVALNIQLKLKEAMENSKSPDGYVYEELGELYLLKNETVKSKKNFALAYEHLSKDQWVVANESEKLKRLKKLSE